MKWILLVLFSCSVSAQNFPSNVQRLPLNPAGGGGGTVTIDTISDDQSSDLNVATLNVTNVVGSGTDRLLTVQTGTGDTVLNARTNISVSSDVSGAFTRLDYQDDTNFCRIEVWYLKAPATGTHIITITCGTGGEKPDNFMVNAISFTNVHQTSTFGTVVKSSPTSTEPSATITLATGDMGLCSISTDSSTLSVSTGTERWVEVNIGGDVSTGASTITGSGSTAMTWTQVNNLCSILAVPILHD